MAHNRILIFNLFLLQPDAVCPFFPGGQPLLPKVWRAGKANPTCSVLFSARGWEAKSEPNVQNLKDTREKKKSEQLDLSFGGNPGCTDKEMVTISQPCAAQRMPTDTREQTQRP